MLHHANVDRFWAYWEAIHPNDSIYEGSYSGGSRFSTAAGAIITPDSPLQPFYGQSNQYHTSETVRSLQGFGYSYVELEYWKKSPAQMAADATQLINQLYGNNRSPKRRATRQTDVTNRYFVHIQLEVEQVDRPCSINVQVGGQSAGNLVVMQQPETGDFYGGFSIDDSVHAAGIQEVSEEAAMDSIKDLLQIEIVKVCQAFTFMPSLSAED